jgi:phytoene/squalene synthetase
LRSLPAEAGRHDEAEAGSRDEDVIAALAAAIRRTRELFDAGRPVCDAVRGRLRYELRATWLGGVRILDRVERSLPDIMNRRPALGPLDAPWLVARLLTWSRTP